MSSSEKDEARYVGNGKAYVGHGDLEVYHWHCLSGSGFKVQGLAHLHWRTWHAEHPEVSVANLLVGNT